MDADSLLTTWLAGSALRPSTRADYAREVGSFLEWCAQQQPPVDPLTARPADIAAWSYDRYLHRHLDGRPFNGPDALGYLATRHPEHARSHDRRISALAGYYDAAVTAGLITLPPDLSNLRTGVHRPAGAKNKLTQMERAVFLTVIGMWNTDRSQHWRRDQLAAFLLLEGLRPAQVIRLDTRNLHPQPDGTWDIRTPDDHDATGRKFTLEPLTGTALKAYLAVRPEPADPNDHTLLLNWYRRPLQSRWPNTLIAAMAATHPLLADRQPPVTADTIAHTGFWDTPAGG
ncbi:hypothetical protein [Streptomyces chilikensis]|uniref:Integrase n=1 Tax=Streptomyces chilikensis TaxID=1194079 RepID=A0ABV3ERH1_9ACTN